MDKFVVYLTYYTGKKLPKWYIGHSTLEKIQNGYNGSVSSKKYKSIYIKEQKENKHLFKTRILSYYKTRALAIIEEERLQLKHNVAKNDKYINMSYARANGFFGLSIFGKDHPSYGKKQSKEYCERIKLRQLGENNSFYGKHHSEETILKIKAKITGKNNHFYGKKHTPESIKKIKELSGTSIGTTYVYNLKLKKTRRVKGEELDILLNSGWIKEKKIFKK